MSNQPGHSHPIIDSHPAQPDLAWNDKVNHFQNRNNEAIRSLVRIVGTFVFLMAVIGLLALIA